MPAVTIIKRSAENMNDVKSEKYGISPKYVEKYPYPMKNLGHYLTDKYDQIKYAADKQNYRKI